MPQQFRLLFVDDEQDILDSLKRTFQRQYKVLTARSGNEAIELLKSESIDLIMSDQRMPDVTGDAVLKFAMQTQPEAIRILLTGYADMESLLMCLNEAGIFKYITKPWEPENLKLTLGLALEGLGLQRQLNVATTIIRKNHYFSQDMINRLKQASDKAGVPVNQIIQRALNKELAAMDQHIV